MSFFDDVAAQATAAVKQAGSSVGTYILDQAKQPFVQLADQGHQGNLSEAEINAGARGDATPPKPVAAIGAAAPPTAMILGVLIAAYFLFKRR